MGLKTDAFLCEKCGFEPKYNNKNLKKFVNEKNIVKCKQCKIEFSEEESYNINSNLLAKTI